MKRKYRFWLFPAAGLMAFVVALTGCDSLLGTKSQNDSDPGDSAADYSSVANILGRGYDVFEKYADPEYIKSPVLDFDALSAAEMIEKTKLEKTTYETVSGTSSTAYQKNMGVTADLEGNYKFFSGSLGGAFSSSTITDSNNQYATIQVRVRKNMYAVKNRTGISVLKNYLDADFRQNLTDIDYSITDLFDNYGTHVMVGIITGARDDYNLAAAESSSNTGQTINAYAQASFAKTFGAAASAAASFSYDSVQCVQ